MPCCRVDDSVKAGAAANTNSESPPRNAANDSRELLKIEGVMRRTKLSRRKILYDKAAGALPYIQFGRSIRFDPADIDAYINRRRVKTRAARGSEYLSP